MDWKEIKTVASDKLGEVIGGASTVYKDMRDYMTDDTDKKFRETAIWAIVGIPLAIWLFTMNWAVASGMLVLWFIENFLRKRWSEMD